MTAAAGSKFLTWGTLDGRLLEIVRVASFERGLRATGTIVRAGRYGASYNLIVGAAGEVRRLVVRTESADGPRSLSLTRNPDGNWVSESNAGSSPMPALAKAEDVSSARLGVLRVSADHADRSVQGGHQRVGHHRGRAPAVPDR